MHVPHEAQGDLRAAHDHPLGDLEGEAVRGQVVPAQARQHVGRQVLVPQLAVGGVHGDVRDGRAPGGELAADLVDDPAAERDHQPRLLHERQEPVRHHEALLRVVPALERLEPVGPTAAEVDDRLVGDRELLVLERPVDLRVQSLLVDGAGACMSASKRSPCPSPAQRLGVVRRRVGCDFHRAAASRAEASVEPPPEALAEVPLRWTPPRSRRPRGSTLRPRPCPRRRRRAQGRPGGRRSREPARTPPCARAGPAGRGCRRTRSGYGRAR